MGELNLKGKVAVVTGASQGLGEALAIRLDKEGCKVAVCDFNIEGAKAQRSDCNPRGRNQLRAMRSDG